MSSVARACAVHGAARVWSPLVSATLLLAALFSAAAWARGVPVLRGRVTDEAGVLGERGATLERRLEQYERDTGHQFAVLVVSSLQGEGLESFSMRVAEQWRLGDRRRDDGLLMLVAVEERAARIEVGYGLEGAVPDVIAGRVMREHMIPHFQDGDYAGGVQAGLDALMRVAEGEALGPSPSGLSRFGSEQRRPQLIVFGLIALSALLRVHRLVRVPFALLLGAFLGYVMLKSVLGAAAVAIALALLALVLPTVRGGGHYGRGRYGHHSSSWGGSSRGSFGGFSGGGGGFGGGGASGRW